jgi:hypothetical protein
MPIGDTMVTIYVSPGEVQYMYPRLGVEEPIHESFAAEVLSDGHESPDSQLESYPITEFEGSTVTLPVASKQQDVSENHIVRVIRAIDILEESVGVVSVWVPSDRWGDQKEKIQDEFAKTINIIKVNGTYADLGHSQ